MFLGLSIAYFVIGGCVSQIFDARNPMGFDERDATERRAFCGVVTLIWPVIVLAFLAFCVFWLVGKAVGR